ncbi:pilin N-terminal domain-containing protein [Lacticaseibacillus absianus]|uniref:pilin N-terminal domain-containing protein n=1 Tax=Lacticaseibacillus absianus TaxID=2729623 RepID=UPI0015CD3EE0|nr:SpaA isopeptide-forming pilin-related protein [Lacticaseibacillus absianus]
MKKLITWFTVLLGALLAWAVTPPAVTAASAVTVTLQHEVHDQQARGHPGSPGAYADFTVYDLTAYYHQRAAQGTAIDTLAKQLGQDDDQAIAAFIAAHHLRAVAHVETDTTGQARFCVDGAWGNAFLVVQTTPGHDPVNALAVNEKSMPIVFSLPQADQAAGITLATKAVRTQRAVYFYKYGRDGRVTAPLAGATFALRRGPAYLTTSGAWRTTVHPLADPQVLKLTSAADGLVLLKDVPLAVGRYVITELKAPAGYQLTRQARQIALQVPQADTDAAITLNGAALRPLLADQVQAREAKRTALRVYNPHTPDQPKTPGGITPGTPGNPLTRLLRHLPQTGEVKTSLALLGLALIGLSLSIGKKIHDIGEREINEK